MAGNSAELYIATPIVPTSLSVTPSTVTLQIGEARSFNVVDHLAHARADAEWSISDPNVATVDPETGVVSAVATGSVVLTATIGAVTAEAQVSVVAAGSLPAGMVRWSAAAPAGFTTKQIVQATSPDGSSPASFAVNGNATDTQIQALSADGQLLWQIWLPAAASNFVPNKSGGLLVTLYNSCDGVNPMRLVSFDGPTGIWAWEFVGSTTCGTETPRIAVRPDGVVAVATPGNLTGFPSFMLLSGTTGTPLYVPAIPASTFTSFGGQQTPGYSRVGPAMVDQDGVVHLLYEKRLVGYPPQVLDTGIWLMSLRYDQTFTTTQLSSTTANTNLFPGNIIPDGHGGLLATWVDSPIVPAGQPPVQSTFRAARVLSASGVTNFDLPLTPPVDLPDQPNSQLPVNPELTLGQNDTAFVAYGPTLVSFDVVSGALIWQHIAPSGSMAMIVSDTTDGILAKNTVGGVDSVLRFNASGGVSTEPLTGTAIDYLIGIGWIGAGAGFGATAYSGSVVDVSTAGWFAPTQGNTRSSVTIVKLVNPLQSDPEQSTIRSVYETAKLNLENDPQLANPTCSTWFNTGFDPQSPVPTAAAYIGQALFPNRFAHAEFSIGGSVVAGEDMSAFTGQFNADPRVTPVGAIAETAVNFNRNGTFFKALYSLAAGNFPRPHRAGPYGGNTLRAQLTIALHELAHLLQDAGQTSVIKVPGFERDGRDHTGSLSQKNTKLILKQCQKMIERVP